jgi:hypothetical protein
MLRQFPTPAESARQAEACRAQAKDRVVGNAGGVEDHGGERSAKGPSSAGEVDSGEEGKGKEMEEEGKSKGEYSGVDELPAALWTDPCPVKIGSTGDDDCENASSGSLTLTCLGEVIHDLKGYHDREHIYPVGYRGTRRFAGRSYNFGISYGSATDGPQFFVRQEGDGDDAAARRCFSEATPSLVWQKVADEAQPGGGQVDGLALHGLSNETIKAHIMSLPRAKKCMMLSADPTVEFEFSAPPTIARKQTKEEERAQRELALRLRQEVARRKMEELEKDKVRMIKDLFLCPQS